ncbi:unnamed protein product [Cunninghamella blakesleeana]
MVASPPTEPSANFDHYEKQETIEAFETIIPYFRRELATTYNIINESTATQLATFTASFQHFQYKALGIPSVIETTQSSLKKLSKTQQQQQNNNNSSGGSTNTSHKTITTLPPCLPSSMFNTDQLNPLSPLYIILKTAYAKPPLENEKWDFDSPRKKDTYIELVETIYEKIKEADVYTPPQILLIGTDDNDKLRQYTNIIKELRGDVVKDFDKATHIINVNDDDEKKGNSRKYARTIKILETKDEDIHVHWYRYPDSFDEWVDEKKIKDNKRVEDLLTASSNTESTNNNNEKTSSPRIYLKLNWLLDSYKFNIWMMTDDYLCSPTTVTGLKRQFEPESINDTVNNKNDNNNKNNNNNNKSNKRMKVVDEERIKKHKEECAKRYLVNQPFEVIIPSYAAWFEFNQIHKVERHALPEFFNQCNNTKTSQTYMDIRNFMVHTYRSNPLEYLTVTACRRNIPGDVCATIRVHGFLEKWGLINYQIDPSLRISNIGPPFSGDFKIVLNLPENLSSRSSKPKQQVTKDNTNNKDDNIVKENNENNETLIKPKLEEGNTTNNNSSLTTENKNNTKIEDTHKQQQQQSILNAKVNLNLEIRQSIYKLPDISNKKSTTKDDSIQLLTSSKMNNNESTDVKKENHNENQQQQTSTVPTNKNKKENNKKGLTPLTDQQKILLLEGLDMYKHDWKEIAKHVGISSEECVLHYLELPLEDPYIDADLLQKSIYHHHVQSNQVETKNENDSDFYEGRDLTISSIMTFLIKNADSLLVTDLLNEKVKMTKSSTATKGEEKKQEDKHQKQQEEEKEKEALLYEMIRIKLATYQQKLQQYTIRENMIEKERQLLETERHQLSIDQNKLRLTTNEIQHQIAKKSAMKNVFHQLQHVDKNNFPPSSSVINIQQQGNYHHHHQQQQQHHHHHPSTSTTVYLNNTSSNHHSSQLNNSNTKPTTWGQPPLPRTSSSSSASVMVNHHHHHQHHHHPSLKYNTSSSTSTSSPSSSKLANTNSTNI